MSGKKYFFTNLNREVLCAYSTKVKFDLNHKSIQVMVEKVVQNVIKKLIKMLS